jgi:glycosyltransferase involved in cell wall biosynthesis
MPMLAASESQIACRLLRPSDANALAKLFGTFHAEGVGKLFHPHDFTYKEAFARANYHGSDIYAVLADGPHIAGYGMLRGWDEGYMAPSLGIAIDPTSRGRGHGRRLMNFLHEIARQRGADKIRLKVYPDNEHAVKMYHSLGYQLEPALDKGQLVCFLDLTKINGKPLNIGILAHDFMNWTGGVDFIWSLTDSLLATARAEKSQFHLLVPDSGLRLFWRKTRKTLRAHFTGDKLAVDRQSGEAICTAFRTFGDRVTIHHIGIGKNEIKRVASHFKLDIVFPALHSLGTNFKHPWLAYAYDFQHKYFPQNFSAESCRSRDKHFGNLLTQAKAVIVNSRSAAADIAKFVPQTTARVYTLPFAASPTRDWFKPAQVSPKNHVAGRYFIISNQFWAHKDHATAFKAFELIAKDFPSVTLVCTGSPSGANDPYHYPGLLRQIEEGGLHERIKLLGVIPKREQIELLKNAVAVVQPTLFEGGPGGGAVFEAIALGVRSIVSGIPVNRELEGLDVIFFPPGNEKELAQRMRESLNIPRKLGDPESLMLYGKSRRIACGQMLWEALDFSIAAASSGNRA